MSGHVCDPSRREESMVVIERADDGTPSVWCDPCISDVVSALNQYGLRTVASCCGHGHRPGLVSLSDGRTLVIASDDELARIESLWGRDINGDEVAR